MFSDIVVSEGGVEPRYFRVEAFGRIGRNDVRALALCEGNERRMLE